MAIPETTTTEVPQYVLDAQEAKGAEQEASALDDRIEIDADGVAVFDVTDADLFDGDEEATAAANNDDAEPLAIFRFQSKISGAMVTLYMRTDLDATDAFALQRARRAYGTSREGRVLYAFEVLDKYLTQESGDAIEAEHFKNTVFLKLADLVLQKIDELRPKNRTERRSPKGRTTRS